MSKHKDEIWAGEVGLTETWDFKPVSGRKRSKTLYVKAVDVRAGTLTLSTKRPKAVK